MKKVIIAVLLLGLAVTTQADVILAWDVQGATTPATLEASTIDPNVTGGTLSRDATLSVATGANAFNSSSWNTGAFAEGQDFITFSLAPVSGYSLTLSSLSYVINGSNTAPGTGAWGFRIGTGAFTIQPGFALTNPAQTTLATWDFDDVSDVTDTVEFRFWAYGSTSIGGGTSTATGTVRIQNIAGNDLILYGQVIPEPSVLALLAIGGVAILRFARRRSA